MDIVDKAREIVDNTVKYGYFKISTLHEFATNRYTIVIKIHDEDTDEYVDANFFDVEQVDNHFHTLQAQAKTFMSKYQEVTMWKLFYQLLCSHSKLKFLGYTFSGDKFELFECEKCGKVFTR